jgi:serine phosphatase RsbU (regulator of sigma subunit)
MALDQEELRLLSEISHKLDYALKSAQHRPGNGNGGATGPAAAGSGNADPEVVRALHAVMVPQPPDRVYEAIMDAAIAVTKAERGFLMLVEEGRKLRFKVGRSVDQRAIQSEGATSKTIIKNVVSTGQSCLVADTSAAGAPTSQSVQGMRMRSILCAPMIFVNPETNEGQVGGIIYLDARALTRTFDDQTKALLEALCAASVTAIQNAVELERARKTGGADTGKLQQNFERLLDVGRSISSTLVLEELLELVMEKALEVTRADRGFLMLLEAGNPEPVFKIGLAWNKQDGPARRLRKLNQTQFFFSRSVTRKALEEKRSVILQDAQGPGGEDASLSIMQMELNSVMCAPLIEKGNTLGLMYVDSKMSAKAFGDSDLSMFEALAGQAAIGLKNALLYSQVASQQRMESEIQIAAEMQRDLCPKVLPQIQGIELAGTMEPAREVGGDYYDFVEDPHDPGQTLGIVVGDVSGKGLGAGIVAVMARCFLRSMFGAYGMESPKDLLSYLHATLCGELKPGKFMTMLLMVWNGHEQKVRYSAAGHENIIVWRAATKKAEVLPSGGTPLGIKNQGRGPTENAELALRPGDTLVLYTDGVTEAMNKDDDEYTLERLVEVVNRTGGQSAQAINKAIMDGVIAWRGAREVSDDITLVILRRL